MADKNFNIMESVTNEVILEHCGYWNTDIAAGWEVGLLGKERIGKTLYNRNPPGHYFEEKNKNRYRDWLLGRDKALIYRERLLKSKTTHFAGETKDGYPITITRKGWGVVRGTVLNRMAKMGCIGDVTVSYYEDDGCKTTLKRTVKCGI
jgi:hypothetical protein